MGINGTSVWNLNKEQIEQLVNQNQGQLEVTLRRWLLRIFYLSWFTTVIQ